MVLRESGYAEIFDLATGIDIALSTGLVLRVPEVYTPISFGLWGAVRRMHWAVERLEALLLRANIRERALRFEVVVRARNYLERYYQDYTAAAETERARLKSERDQFVRIAVVAEDRRVACKHVAKGYERYMRSSYSRMADKDIRIDILEKEVAALKESAKGEAPYHLVY